MAQEAIELEIKNIREVLKIHNINKVSKECREIWRQRISGMEEQQLPKSIWYNPNYRRDVGR